MAKLGISTGITPNDGQGDALNVAGNKINKNFDEVYTLCGTGTTLFPGIVTSMVAGTNISISTSFGQVTINSQAAGSVWQQTSIGINTDTNVGIATTNPQSKFQVGQGISFTVTQSSYKDNIIAKYGTSDDLWVYHDGTNSLVKQVNAIGSLLVQGDTLKLQDYSQGHDYLTGIKDGAVSAYFDNSLKWQTTGAGTSTLGICSATSFLGPLTGIVTGNVTGLIDSSNVAYASTVNRLNSVNISAVGMSTIGSLGITTNFTVGGNTVLTGLSTFTGITKTGSDLYVGRNLDAVGIVTAVKFSGPTSGGLQVTHGTGAVGILTVTGIGVSMAPGKRADLSGYSEAFHDLGSLSAGTHALDISQYSTFKATIDGTTAVTFSLTGPTAARTFSGVLILYFTGTGTRSVSFNFAPKWAGGSAPTWSATNAKTDIVSFFTPDNATNTYMNVLGLGFA